MGFRILGPLEVRANGEPLELGGQKQRALLARLLEQLLLALSRARRQAEALAAHQDARSTLVEELGIEPGKPLRELQQAILRQDPALDFAPVALPAAEAARGIFVGRERELAEL